MKIKTRFIAILLIAFALILVGCGNTNTPETITITPLQEKITLNVDEVLDYDYTSLFTIKSGTSDIEVEKEYLDLTNLKKEVGTYFVLCTYKNQMASVNVEVIQKTTVKISLTTTSDVVVNNLNVFEHDYKQYFEIVDVETIVEVKDEYLDLSNLRASAGTYKVICNYNNVSQVLNVKVEEVSYQIKLSVSEITVKQSEAKSHNFNQYFTVVVNGKIQNITQDMVESNVSSDVGVYQYKVSLGETSMALKVKVISDHTIEIINSYALKEIEISEINTFDLVFILMVKQEKLHLK